jgi:protein-ribulosamine 3-kinase
VRDLIHGEVESLKAIHAVVPVFAPEIYAYGPLSTGIGYFLLAEFRSVGQQPADPKKLAKNLAELHQQSVSPTGKFGFHASSLVCLKGYVSLLVAISIQERLLPRRQTQT